MGGLQISISMLKEEFRLYLTKKGVFQEFSDIISEEKHLEFKEYVEFMASTYGMDDINHFFYKSSVLGYEFGQLVNNAFTWSDHPEIRWEEVSREWEGYYCNYSWEKRYYNSKSFLEL